MAVRVRQALSIWHADDAASEFLAYNIVKLDGATDARLIHPYGGKDGKKDLFCTRGTVKCVGAVFFRQESGNVKFPAVKEKFNHDLPGVKKHSCEGFIFVTNVHVTEGEKNDLIKLAEAEGCKLCVIYALTDLEGLLDDPRSFGFRREYVKIEMTPEEKVAADRETVIRNEEVLQKHQKEMAAKFDAVVAQILEHVKK